MLEAWKPEQRGSVSSEGLCEAGPQIPDFEQSPWLYCEAGLELQRRRKHQEAAAGIQRETLGGLDQAVVRGH